MTPQELAIDKPEPASLIHNDPFSLAYRALRQMLLDAPGGWPIKADDFPDMSDPKYIFDFNSDSPADFPNTMLLQSVFLPFPFGKNSMSFGSTQSYPLITVVDSMSVGDLNAIKWATTQAMASAKDDLGLKPVISWTTQSGRDSYTDNQEFRRGERRWTSLITFVVNLNFERIRP